MYQSANFVDCLYAAAIQIQIQVYIVKVENELELLKLLKFRISKLKDKLKNKKFRYMK